MRIPDRAKNFAKTVKNFVKLKLEKEQDSRNSNVDYFRSAIDGGKTGNLPKTTKTWEKVYKEHGSKPPPDVEPDSQGKIKNSKSRTGAIITLAIIGVFGFFIYGLFFNAAINSVFLGIFGPTFNTIGNYPVSGVPLKYSIDYLGCVAENSWFTRLVTISPGSPLGSEVDDPFAFCKQELLSADEVGCTECFDMTIDAPNQRLLAGTGQSALYIVKLRAEQPDFCYNNFDSEQTCQPLTPAANPEIFLKDEKGTDFSDQFQRNFDPDELDELDPSVITDTPLTAVATIPGDKFCGVQRNVIDMRGILKYTYRTEGSAPIVVRAGGTDPTFFSTRNPISLPGPLKVDIIPDAISAGGSYEEGLNTVAFLFIKLRNTGSGEVKVKQLTIEQIFPERRSPLEIKSCAGPSLERISSPQDVGGEFPRSQITLFFGNPNNNNQGEEYVNEGIPISPNERSSTILCQLSLKNLKDEETGAGISPGSSLTYIVIGKANYDYTLERSAPSIIVDQTNCGEGNKEPLTPGGTTQEPSGSETQPKEQGTGGETITLKGSLTEPERINYVSFNLDNPGVYLFKMLECDAGEKGPIGSILSEFGGEVENEGSLCDGFEYQTPEGFSGGDQKTFKVESNGWIGEYTAEISKIS